jgi:predicted nucleic acid-binding protein
MSRKLKKLRELLTEVKALSELVLRKHGVIPDIILKVEVNNSITCNVDECIMFVVRSEQKWEYIVVSDYAVKKIVVTPKEIRSIKPSKKELKEILQKYEDDINKAAKKLNDLIKLLEATEKRQEKQLRKQLVQDIEKISDEVRQQLQR